MRKNISGQVIGAQMVSASDGSPFTGSVTCYVTGDGGTQAAGSVGSGACTHEGNGFHSYAPAQAETNYDHVAFTFTGTGAVPATVQVYPSHPQTGDAFARLGAPAGASIAADIADVPTVSELNARTLPAADYFDPATDTVANVTTVGSVTGAVGSVTGNVGGNVAGSVGSISGVSFPSNFADLAITATTGRVTAGTVSDKTGYALSSSQSFDLAGNITGNLSGSVGSVTATVDANLVEVGGDAIPATDVAGVPKVDLQYGDGLALYPATQAGGDGTATLVLAADEPPGTEAFVGHRLLFPASGEVGTISAYDGTTKTATFSPALDQAISTAGGLRYVDLGPGPIDIDAIWDEAIEGSHTARQLLRGFAAALLAKASGLGTATATFRDVGDAKDRITATTDADGNRSAVTLDLT